MNIFTIFILYAYRKKNVKFWFGIYRFNIILSDFISFSTLSSFTSLLNKDWLFIFLFSSCGFSFFLNELSFCKLRSSLFINEVLGLLLLLSSSIFISIFFIFDLFFGLSSGLELINSIFSFCSLKNCFKISFSSFNNPDRLSICDSIIALNLNVL